MDSEEQSDTFKDMEAETNQMPKYINQALDKSIDKAQKEAAKAVSITYIGRALLGIFTYFFKKFQNKAINALSFYRSQNVLCLSKFFEPVQKFNDIECLFKNFCNQIYRMEIIFWCGTNVWDWHKM